MPRIGSGHRIDRASLRQNMKGGAQWKKYYPNIRGKLQCVACAKIRSKVKCFKLKCGG